VAGLAAAITLAVVAPAAAVNPQVAGLQVALELRGFYRGPIDAVQGPETRSAVQRFQTTAGLVPDGLAGPHTRKALGRLGRPLYGSRPLKLGTVGWDVAVLQFLLAARGFSPGKPDGHFGPRTRKALVTFQRHSHLQPDGVLGPRTAAALCSAPSCAYHATPARRYLRYLVRAGDTLTAIADRYELPLATVAQLNRVDPAAILQVGARLRIPLAAMQSGAETSRASVRATLDRWSAYYGVDPHLVRGLAWMESGYQQTVVSAVGAVGVMQVTPGTWAYAEQQLIGHAVTHDLEGNIRVGVAYLRELLREFGNAADALAAYVQGPASIQAQGQLPETQLYVADVLALRDRL
jgi:soluble lytic murein transglycosylase-like protein